MKINRNWKTIAIDPRRSLVPATIVLITGGFLSFATHTNTISIPSSLRILNITSIVAFPVIVGTLSYTYFRTEVSLWEIPVVFLWGYISNNIVLFILFFATLDSAVSSTASPGSVGVSRGLWYLKFFALSSATYSLLYGFAAARHRILRILFFIFTPILYCIIMIALLVI